MRKPHYAWMICFACLLLYVCNMGLCSNILTIYLPFIENTGISHSSGSAILSIRCLFSFLSTFFVDALYRRLSIRKGLLLTTLVGVAAPLVFSINSGVISYYLGAALAGIAYGAGCIYPSALLISNWFNTNRGLAVGISSAGSGLATMLFSPLLSSVVIKFSLSSAFILQAVFMLLCAGLTFIIIRDRPSEMSLEPFSKGKSLSKARLENGLRPLSRTLMTALAFMMLLNGGAGLAFSGHLSVLNISCGYTPEHAANSVSCFGLILIISKLASGSIADHIGTLKCSVVLISSFIFGCCFVLGMDGNNAFWSYGLVMLLGFGASVYNVCPPLWASELSPKSDYSRTLKHLQLFYNLGGIIFTVIPGFIAERTGEYKSSYILFAVMMFLSLLILCLSYIRQRTVKLPK